MARENLPDSMRFIMKWEGGFVDDPDDRGGRTNRGITQKVYNDWRRGIGQPSRDVKQIGDEEVQAIYDGNYWIPAGCDLLRRNLDLAQFDTAVNMGTGRAIRILQEAVGTRVDGQFGPTTKRACDACDLGTTLTHYTQIREGLYRRFSEAPGQSKFLRGWMNRLNDLRREIGLPGFEHIPQKPDFGDMPYIARIPDLPESAPLEHWD
ncbi:glycosyl hydrolase 108 family protein [Sinorhizobium sp. 8-89]|uniref:glycoside hydrolase family 108 protein n=1 Tax=Sinorhizobium sp. 7-81 TaxID=3049087 RepID=UPI0024C344F7|nr:glycosyl hydrolase 108 family protein [Sinorhizobium sp. 7-81]MDK1388851.1 glycosyl hydrolase 108 family protein [Sinorhizobium sp. 7-81]